MDDSNEKVLSNIVPNSIGAVPIILLYYLRGVLVMCLPPFLAPAPAYQQTVSQCHSEALAEESLIRNILISLDSSLRSE